MAWINPSTIESGETAITLSISARVTAAAQLFLAVAAKTNINFLQSSSSFNYSHPPPAPPNGEQRRGMLFYGGWIIVLILPAPFSFC